MADAQRFDLLILGGGMSYVGAIRAAQLGLNVGLVERDRLGGTCLNRGCIPSKALLETADLLHRVQEQGAEFGLSGNDGIGLDYGALGARRDMVVDKHVSGVEFLLKKNKVTVLHGNGVLTGATSVRVSGGESGQIEASATNLILATGSAPRSLPGLDPDDRLIITSDEALVREDVPKRVTIVGACWARKYSASLMRSKRSLPMSARSETPRICAARGLAKMTLASVAAMIRPSSIDRSARPMNKARCSN